MTERTLITSALPYANGDIHLGHIAGAYLPADIYSRFLRLYGEEVLYVCGSDEHGVAITISAEKGNTNPQSIIDKYHNANKKAYEDLGISFDIFSRTSLPEHHETAREFFSYYLEKGFLQEREEEQFYDEQTEMFLPDRYVEGICPNCNAENARGDQCDKCGAYYNQTELKNPISVVTGNTPVVKKTNHWYMQFDKFQEFLEEYIESHDKDWKDNVLQQTRSWLKQGMQARAITRDLTWGVPLKGITGISDEKAEKKVLYVWFDAVLGYITATKIWCKNNNDDWKRWWKNDKTEYLAFIGKDNIVFHTIIFPSLLKGRNDFILPSNVPANEFLNLEGQKLSKSRGWTIEMKDFAAEYPEAKYIDAMRYVLAVNFPETKDADFTWKDFAARNNNELAAIYGNFVNRTLVFLGKQFDGKVPELNKEYQKDIKKWEQYAVKLSENNFSDNILADVINDINDEFSDNDALLLSSLFTGIKQINENYRKFRFRDAITETMNVARAANKFFNDEEPWKSAKANPEQCAKTMFYCLQIVRSLGVLFAPLLPHISNNVFDILDIENQYLGDANKRDMIGINQWFETAQPLLKEGKQLNKPIILFEKIDETFVEKQVNKLVEMKKKSENSKPKKPEYEEITIDDFSKIKLVTAKVLEAEKIKKSKKLLKLQVDLGWEKRQILAGVALHYKPEDLIGKTIVVVANLKPAKLMGQLSEGMMLCAATQDEKLIFVSPVDETGPGAEVR